MPLIEELLGTIDIEQEELERRGAIEAMMRSRTRKELIKLVEESDGVYLELAQKEVEIRADFYHKFPVKHIQRGTIRYSAKRKVWYYLDPPSGNSRDERYEESV